MSQKIGAQCVYKASAIMMRQQTVTKDDIFPT